MDCGFYHRITGVKNASKNRCWAGFLNFYCRSDDSVTIVQYWKLIGSSTKSLSSNPIHFGDVSLTL